MTNDASNCLFFIEHGMIDDFRIRLSMTTNIKYLSFGLEILCKLYNGTLHGSYIKIENYEWLINIILKENNEKRLNDAIFILCFFFKFDYHKIELLISSSCFDKILFLLR